MSRRGTMAPRRRSALSRRLRWGFRLAAAGLGLSVFLILELACLLAGWGEPEIGDNPFVEFSAVRPLFELTEDGTQFHTSPVRRGYFKEDSFAADKPDGEFRIFVFGGSTVQGNPFSLETSFPSYLEIALEKANPGRSWKVVNCGGVSYASYRLLPIMIECVAYEPDLFIFCEGHNEFLEDVSYSAVRTTHPLIQQTFAAFSQFRFFRALRHRCALMTGQTQTANGTDGHSRINAFPEPLAKPLLPEEVDTLLDHDGGLAVYHRDDQHARTVAEHFRQNLERFVELCDSHDVPLALILPPSNLSDCPPFKSEFSASVSKTEKSRLHQLLQDARAEASSNLENAVQLTRSALEIDPRYALAWYELGQLQLTDRRFEEAELAFVRARDEDVCPLRITSPLDSAMRQVATHHRLPLIDVQALLKARCSNGIVGMNVLVDHVHPSFHSHEDIAIEIADWMIAAGFASATQNDWQQATHAACQSRLQSLDNLYFLRGQRALENLRLWAAGRSGGPPLQKQKQER